MSGLSYICEYSSDSETSDCEQNTRLKLPTPNLSKVRVVEFETHTDDPALHGGSIRSFPHVRGNWATYIYIKYPAEENLSKLIGKIDECISQNESWNQCNDVHISLSKTFTIQYHMIVPITNSFQNIFKDKESFELEFSGLKVYCNEQKTRTFISLEVEHYSQRNLLSLTENIDETLIEYKLPTFYEDPSFHMSILWANGDKQIEASKIVEHLNKSLSSELDKIIKPVIVDKVYCKTGNKHFQYYLK